MKILAIIILAIAVAQSKSFNEIEEKLINNEKLFFLDDEGNVIEITDDDGFETIEETEANVSERVFFHLYTINNPTTSQELKVGDFEILTRTHFDPKKLTRIVIHGWTNSHESTVPVIIRDAYLQNGDHNVIVIDWSTISRMPYGAAVRRLRIVAGYIAKMIDFLETKGLDISELVIVGHSLGAHIGGVSGHFSKNTVGHVVALDPAGPFFNLAKPGYRVDKEDAENVQVIHTNDGRFGLGRVLGDFDFYPNGGSSQPGCGLDVTGICAHASVARYFAESINSDVGFYGQLCRSWNSWRIGRCKESGTAFMGGNLLVKNSEFQGGTYYLRTSDSSPFALGPISA